MNIHFGVELINDLYGLLDVDIDQFEEKRCELGSLLVEKLCPGRVVPWALTMMGISFHDFTVKERI